MKETATTGEQGGALISVTWIILLLSLLAVGVLSISIKSRQNLLVSEEELNARLISESAIDLFMNRYFYDEEEQVHRKAIVEILDHSVAIEVWFEKGRINLNEANTDVLSAMFAAQGMDASLSRALAARIVDWRDQDSDAELFGAEEADYRNAGLSYIPRNDWFESVGELQHVLGVTPEQYFCVSDMVTVYSKKASITELSYARPNVRKVFEWAYQNEWNKADWIDPDTIESKVDFPSGGDDVVGSALRVQLELSGQYSGQYEAVIRFMSASGAAVRFETILPVWRVVSSQVDSCEAF